VGCDLVAGSGSSIWACQPSSPLVSLGDAREAKLASRSSRASREGTCLPFPPGRAIQVRLQVMRLPEQLCVPLRYGLEKEESRV
jgi:hypothetical protein